MIKIKTFAFKEETDYYLYKGTRYYRTPWDAYRDANKLWLKGLVMPLYIREKVENFCVKPQKDSDNSIIVLTFPWGAMNHYEIPLRETTAESLKEFIKELIEWKRSGEKNLVKTPMG